MYVPSGDAMLTRVAKVGLVFTVVAGVSVFAQEKPPAQTPPASPPTPAAPASPGQGPSQPPGRGTGGMKVGQTGNPDPGVNFLVVVENPQVRVLQVTLQPGAIRRPHVHNDVTFHMLVPVTGSLDLTIEKEPVVTTVPGQAYYMVKGQTHGFTNKSSAAVQVIELFIKEPAPAQKPETTATQPEATPAAGTTATPAETPAAPK
jgi:quercetin dioxygenase-like cupin family protein